MNIRYCQRFYEFYCSERNLPQLVEELVKVPWGHHRLLMDKCKGDSRMAVVDETYEESGAGGGEKKQ